jgi:hypothetical protein
VGEPGHPDPGPARRRRVPGLVLAAAAAAVAAAVASGVALSNSSTPGRAAGALPTAPSRAVSPGSPPPSAPSASAQAAAVSALVDSSAATRTALRDAVRQVRACTNLPGAVGQLQDVVSQRLTEYRQASALRADALADGNTVKSDLIAALSTSLRADRDYLAWAQQEQAGGCTPSDQSGAYRAALSASQVADPAKQAFVQVWNPVAARYGIRAITPGSF